MKKFILLSLICLTACSQAPDSTDLKFSRIGSDIYAVVIPSSATTVEVERASKAQCGDAMVCQVLGWNDPAKIAVRLPMTNPETAAQVFAFNLNRNTGLEEAKWECATYPAAPRARCFTAPTIEDLEEADRL